MKHTLYIANLSSGSAPVVPLWWQEFGACANKDPENFFPEKGGSTKAARAICAICDSGIKAECLAYAIFNNEQYGIWGGTSERQRQAIRRQAKGNGTDRGYAGRTRTLVPIEPFRAALLALIPSQFPTRNALGAYVAARSSLKVTSVSDAFQKHRQNVTLEWASIVCEALGIDPAQFWPEEAAA